MAWGKNGTPSTLGGTASTIEITDLTSTKFNTFLAHLLTDGSAVNQHLRVNDASGSVYADRQSINGGTDNVDVNRSQLTCAPTNGATDTFIICYALNISGEERLFLFYVAEQGASGASTAPARTEGAGKYVTDTNITEASFTETLAGSYAASSNISALGSDLTPSAAVPFPSDVQVGSRAEITDTRKMYHFEAESPIETLDSTNGTTDWNVTNGGSDITIDTSNNEIDITGTGEKSGYYDLGASVSASSWLLRFKITSSGSPSGNPLFWVGMFDVNTIGSRNTNVDGISLMIYTGSNYLLSMKNGSHMDSGGSQTDTSPTVSADTTTRYVEIVRNGSNAILTFYDSDTYTTSIGTCTVAITGSAFRYLCAISYFEGSGRTYSLSNVKFYNGTTTTVMPNAWSEEGT